MLYKKSKEATLSKELFENPTSEYRGAPFWAWNCELKKDELLWQIEQLKAMGLGGFHMHSRDGMATPYLSDEFMDLVKACVDKAEQEDMQAYLYDEDRWPSGSAGGLVTKDKRYAQRFLLFTTKPEEDTVSFEEAYKTGKTYFAAAYDIMLNKNGELEQYKKINLDEDAKGTKWYAYIKTPQPSGWYNNECYVNTLSKEAIDKFIAITHETYKKAVGDKFGTVIPSIFTDEPAFAHKETLDFAKSKMSVKVPWAMDLEDTYKEHYGDSLMDKLPELFWELPNSAISTTRYNYHDHITFRFTEAFADNCGIWCENNGIALTGHMLEEPTLESQTGSIGEAMRAYTHFGIPGIDMLCNSVQTTTAKQAQSNVHQYGKEGVMSELYGVTNWDFDFRGHKFQGDWQAALGVTLRVHHLSWVSMKGSAKRDYPASINYQSPWYKEYRYVEDHFARLNTVLTRGKPEVKVGVIHPIETYWLHFGPKENTAAIRERLDKQFMDMNNWLLTGLVDFDYICESTLPAQCKAITDTLQVGEMKYSAIVVAGCETLRSSTLEILEKYQKAGGKIIFAGDAPKYINAKISDDAKKLYDKCINVQFNNTDVMSALEEERIVDIRESNGTRTNNLVYQYRKDNDCEWIFIAHIKEEDESINITARKDRKIIIKGEFTPEIYDTISGEIKKPNFEIENGKTIIYYGFYSLDSLLLKLNSPTERAFFVPQPETKIISEKRYFEKVAYKREEENVLLLDIAQYHIDDETFTDEYEELLEINRICKERLNIINNGTQPWTITPEPIKHHLTLKYTFESEIDYDGAFLATEDADVCKIIFNGEKVENITLGYFTDKSIEKIPLPHIKKGTNELVITYPIGPRANAENCFILGDFDVKCDGVVKTITPKTEKISFGDIVSQGMPFYGGNIVYKTEFEAPEDCNVVVNTSVYKGALVKVKMDGEDVGVIAYSPYDVTVNNVKKGKHTVEFTLFGNRINSFGALHLTDTKAEWFGPDAWVKNAKLSSWGKADSVKYPVWQYEYTLKPNGILASPIITMTKEM